MTEPGGKDYRGGGSLGRCGANHARDSSRRSGDDRDIWSRRQRLIGFDRGDAFDLVVMRIDEMNCAGKSTAAEVFQNRAAGRCVTRAAADHNDRARRK